MPTVGEDGTVAASPYRICFVCLGNICRSPMASVVMRRLVADAGLDIQVDSAGTGSWHVGGPADHSALRAMTKGGYDGSTHVARQFSARDFAAYDLVVGLDRQNVRDLRRMAPDPAAAAKIRLLRDFAPDGEPDLDVTDPYGGPDDGFDEALEVVFAACRGLLDTLPAAAR
ncbi:MAG: low molecular weight phosphotyrosine protein phosphatase [Geodermatophilaceae bacterium]|nr:low molecular weight phosphotyrosine protein phosphatase [Geodermatophilaceae bacterium]